MNRPQPCRETNSYEQESCRRFRRPLSIASRTTLDSRWNAAGSPRQRLHGSCLRQSNLIWSERWVVYQSRIESEEPGKIYLLRVFVDFDRRPAEVVTAYRTSKVEKYWKRES
jgi:hypothetical protein